MRWIVAMIAISGCTGDSCDPDAWLAELAGPGAIACGQFGALADDTLPADLHACAEAALAERAAFWFSVDQFESDARDMTGFAYAGGDDPGVQVVYGGTVPVTGVGPSSEDFVALACTSLVLGEVSCPSLYVDACVSCDAPHAMAPSCPEPR